MNKYFAISTILSALLINIQPATAVNVAEFHYKAAEKYAHQERPADALKEYNQAIAKDGSNFNYWLGKGQSELVIKDYAALENTLDKLSKLKNSNEQKFEWLLLAAHAQFATKEKGWLSKTKKLFFQAQTLANKLGLERSDLPLLIARVYRESAKDKKARKYYSDVIMLGGPDAAIANNELASMFRQAQAAGTGKGWIGDLAGKPTIDRATLSYLLVDDMGVEDLFLARTSKASLPEDVDGHEFSSAIETVLNLQMTSLGLDAQGNFNPESAVTRYELAKLIEEILVVHARKPDLLRAFIGSKSPFPDVSANFHAYNAVFLSVSRGLMTVDDLIQGNFAGKKPVSGADILLVLRRLGTLKRAQ